MFISFFRQFRDGLRCGQRDVFRTSQRQSPENDGGTGEQGQRNSILQRHPYEMEEKNFSLARQSQTVFTMRGLRRRLHEEIMI